jgi:hypothetical protein
VFFLTYICLFECLPEYFVPASVPPPPPRRSERAGWSSQPVTERAFKGIASQEFSACNREGFKRDSFSRVLSL